MLSLFDGLDEQRFVVWVKDDGEVLHLILSDGEDVWQSPHPITSHDKPASRKHEADDAFMSRLKRALKKDVRDSHGAFEVEIKPLESDIQLVIKETIGTTTTKSILFKSTLERSYDRKGCFFKIFSQASEQMQKDVLEMISLNKSIADFTALVESLSNNTKDMTTLKEKLHDELVSKFCMVLNTKKREIERLNERIEELENQYESAQNTQNTQGVVDLSQASQSTAAPKAPKAPRGRAAPKTTTMECVTGTKRKAAPAKKAAPASKKKAPGRKSARRRVDSDESEDELEDSESGDEEDEEESHQAEDDSREEEGQSDQEMDIFDDEDVPTVTQGSAPGTQAHGSADNTPLALRGRARGKAANTAGNSSSSSGAAGKSKGGAAPPVTLSAPLVADHALLRSVEEEESEEELLHSRPRLARGAAKESPAPIEKVAGKANTHAVSHVSGAKPVTQQHDHSAEVPHTYKGIAAPAAKSSKSKFYAEDSDEEGNCLDYL